MSAVIEPLVQLVNPSNEAIGTCGKLEAHQKGLLHRAFSVILLNEKGETLLQQRAKTKYHWALKWTNSCCSHPYPKETTIVAATRRLNEELGLTCALQESFSFIYKAFDADSGLTEHEHDTVFFGYIPSNASIPFNTEEVQATKWVPIHSIKDETLQNETNYTFWFIEILQEIEKRKIDLTAIATQLATHKYNSH